MYGVSVAVIRPPHGRVLALAILAHNRLPLHPFPMGSGPDACHWRVNHDDKDTHFFQSKILLRGCDRMT
ncbi:unannotated protein [freshwater metagenome]|uniref:Unannotated protein n=1 Tax=freshwater metagenome TaxID=449393 RepID=A0A6J6LCB9_9ZZZZ